MCGDVDAGSQLPSPRLTINTNAQYASSEGCGVFNSYRRRVIPDPLDHTKADLHKCDGTVLHYVCKNGSGLTYQGQYKPTYAGAKPLAQLSTLTCVENQGGDLACCHGRETVDVDSEGCHTSFGWDGGRRIAEISPLGNRTYWPFAAGCLAVRCCKALVGNIGTRRCIDSIGGFGAASRRKLAGRRRAVGFERDTKNVG